MTPQDGSRLGGSFGSWLLTQTGDEGWIGALAKAAKADRAFPRDADPDAVRAHLSSKQAEGDMFEAVDAAETAWPGYSRD
jgi:hypothetical protein